ncbi:hypothetical protein [Paenibacillus sp. 8b26]|uniref:hypothetical protein n=1 Tax=Paenibacillus sp. 8b26 TaxID=3424133 RepID=UPI003D653E01
MRFYKQRLRYILLPYIMFSLFYFVLSLAAGSSEPCSVTALEESFAVKLANRKGVHAFVLHFYHDAILSRIPMGTVAVPALPELAFELKGRQSTC